jgi:hypothetical protein
LEIARQNPGPPMQGFPGSTRAAPPTATGTTLGVQPPMVPPTAQAAPKQIRSDLTALAKSWIKRGANETAVRKRFKELTGTELE